MRDSFLKIDALIPNIQISVPKKNPKDFFHLQRDHRLITPSIKTNNYSEETIYLLLLLSVIYK